MGEWVLQFIQKYRAGRRFVALPREASGVRILHAFDVDSCKRITSFAKKACDRKGLHVVHGMDQNDT
jgi:hypothetical protein